MKMNDGIVFDFDQANFFSFILPPIVFAAGYTLKRKDFLRNIHYILGLGVIGTIIACIVISLITIAANEAFATEIENPLGGEPIRQTWVSTNEVLLLAGVLCSTDTIAVITIITPDKYRTLN